MLTPQQAKRLAAELFDDADQPVGADSNPPLPERIGSYRIRRIIAAGGMGTVYEAEQTHPHRTVALKVMKREYGLRGRRVPGNRGPEPPGRYRCGAAAAQQPQRDSHERGSDLPGPSPAPP